MRGHHSIVCGLAQENREEKLNSKERLNVKIIHHYLQVGRKEKVRENSVRTAELMKEQRCYLCL